MIFKNTRAQVYAYRAGGTGNGTYAHGVERLGCAGGPWLALARRASRDADRAPRDPRTARLESRMTQSLRRERSGDFILGS